MKRSSLSHAVEVLSDISIKKAGRTAWTMQKDVIPSRCSGQALSGAACTERSEVKDLGEAELCEFFGRSAPSE